jgi:hypothetical protein
MSICCPDVLIHICYGPAALRWCLKRIESVLRSFLWWDESNFCYPNSFEAGPLLLRSVVDAADLAAPVGLDAYNPLIGFRWQDLRADWYLDDGFLLGRRSLEKKGLRWCSKNWLGVVG